jgi:hypothetical protein
MATIRITPKVPLVQGALRVRPLRVTVDAGQEQELSLSEPTELQVAAGTHRVEMYVPWVLPTKMGPAEVEVSLEDDQTVDLRYKPPWIRTRPGRLDVTS